MIYNKKWTLKYKGKITDTDLSDKINISPEISQILNNRGIDNEKDAEIFMNPSLEYLRDPFLMKDMKKATDRIKKAIENNERIYIYGDYETMFQQGDSTIDARKELLTEQRKVLEKKIKDMNETLGRLNHKIELYEKGLMINEKELREKNK